MPKAATDMFDLDRLAKLVGASTYDEIWEANIDYTGEARYAAEQEARAAGASEAEAEEAGYRGEEAASDEVYGQHKRAVEAAVEYLLEKHNLELIEGKKGLYKIVPTTSWRDAAEQIIQTINGVGTFTFRNATELRQVGPYPSDKQAVLHHLHWIKDWPAVYGEKSARRVYEDAWR